MYLDIVSRGTPAAGALHDGDHLAADRSQVAIHVNRVLDVFQPPTRRHFKQLLVGLGEGLGDDGQQLRRTFVELTPFLRAAARLTREMAVRAHLTRRLIHNARLLFDELGRRDKALTGLVVAGGDTLGVLDQKRAALGALFRELPPTLQRADSSLAALRGALGALDPALVALREPVSALQRGLVALRRFSADARPALTTLRPAVVALTPLARTLPPVAGDLADAFGRLRPQAPELDRVTADVAGCQFAIQKFFQNTISVFKFGDANGAYPRGEAAQGTDTAGVADLNLRRGKSCARRVAGG
jgi:ABC-type transporter Mla subunit MlaD